MPLHVYVGHVTYSLPSWKTVVRLIQHQPRFGKVWPLAQMGYCTLVLLIFQFYVIFDTQLMLGQWGGHELEFSIDDYAFAAMSLYLDIINLFLNIVQILGLRDN